MDSICLCDLKVGEVGEVLEIYAEPFVRRRLLDIGLVRKTRVRKVGKSPFKDPSAYLIRGAVIAIRDDDAKKVYIKKVGK